MRRFELSLLLLASTSCRQIFGLHELTGDGGGGNGDSPRGGDGGPTGDTMPLGDAPAGCLGAGSFAVCFAQQPTGDQSGLTGAINTDTDPRCESVQPTGWTASQPAACFIYANNITTISGTTLSATGSRPLVLAATNSVTLSGVVDVASHVSGTIGASADYTSCSVSSPPAQGGRGGGAGGSFTTPGADGGGVGGIAGAVLSAPTNLHGGCRGQSGDGANSSGAGASGASGGVVYIVAGVAITIAAAIDASGAGGKGGAPGGGGGGGGSGGMIVLVAPAIDLTGSTIYADGGGGGGGGSASLTGVDGGDPGTTMPGLGGQQYAAGGTGYHDSNDATVGGNGQASVGVGGGGGGGGGGYILFSGSVKPADRVSPPAM